MMNQWILTLPVLASESFRVTDPESKVMQGWSGLYPGTIDYMPVIDEPLPGFVTAAGFSGTGLMHAPAVGEIVAGLVVSDMREIVDITSLASTRFTHGSKVLESTGF